MNTIDSNGADDAPPLDTLAEIAMLTAHIQHDVTQAIEYRGETVELERQHAAHRRQCGELRGQGGSTLRRRMLALAMNKGTTAAAAHHYLSISVGGNLPLLLTQGVTARPVAGALTGLVLGVELYVATQLARHAPVSTAAASPMAPGGAPRSEAAYRIWKAIALLVVALGTVAAGTAQYLGFAGADVSLCIRITGAATAALFAAVVQSVVLSGGRGQMDARILRDCAETDRQISEKVRERRALTNEAIAAALSACDRRDMLLQSLPPGTKRPPIRHTKEVREFLRRHRAELRATAQRRTARPSTRSGRKAGERRPGRRSPGNRSGGTKKR